MQEVMALVNQVRQIAYDIHAYHGHGHLENLGYLKSARMEHGLLINFGSCQFQIRKLIWTEIPSVVLNQQRVASTHGDAGYLTA